MSVVADDALIAPLADLPQLLRTQTDQIEARLRRLITTPDIYRLRQILLIGCGDSLIAAVAAAPTLRAWTGLPVQAMPAMEAARYIDGAAPRGNPRGVLALCISNSGEVARVVEAALHLRHWGALTVALTAYTASRLAQAVEIVGDIAVPASPGALARGYAAALLGVWLIGIRIAEARLRDTMDVANARRRSLTQQADVLEHALPSLAAGCNAAVARWHGARCADLLGSGPLLGSAQYAAAKLMELGGIHSDAQDVEEFHHLNYFVLDPQAVPTVLFTASGSPAASRAQELIRTLEELGRPGLVLTDQETRTRQALSSVRHLHVPMTAEWLLPLLHAVPAVMLACSWAAEIGAIPFRGHAGPWRGASDAGLVRNSAILGLAGSDGRDA